MAAEADQEAGCLSAALGRDVKKNACFRLSPDGAGLPVRNVRKRKRDAAERGQCHVQWKRGACACVKGQDIQE